MNVTPQQEHVPPLSNETKYLYFQIIAGVVNIISYENPSVVQVRRISNFYSSRIANADIAIAKMHQPFQFTYAVQGVTLTPAGPSPPGNYQFYNLKKQKDQDLQFLLKIQFVINIPVVMWPVKGILLVLIYNSSGFKFKPLNISLDL